MTTRSLNVFIASSDIEFCDFVDKALSEHGHSCLPCLNEEQLEVAFRTQDPDLVFFCTEFGKTGGIELLRRYRETRPAMAAFIVSNTISVDLTAKAIAAGASEYMLFPIPAKKLHEIALHTERSLNSTKYLPKATATIEGGSPIIGRSAKMVAVYNAIARVAPSNATVLITGASGTGKELVARAIHEHSARSAKPFIPVNCGAFTETVLESELFGHEKGAFTGAESSRKGLVEAADGGTLFLDEISETAVGFQVMLLRALQEQQVRRVGSNTYIPVNVRIIAASNRDIGKLIAEGKFREDLFYRLSVVQISVPVLRERREDIPLIVNHFLHQFNMRNNRAVAISPEAVDWLAAQEWPGNVRELENAIYRLAIFAPMDQIGVVEAERTIRHHHGLNVSALSDSLPRSDRLQDQEKQHIARVLREVRGNKAEAARRLGIQRKSLYKKVVRLGISLDDSTRT